MSVDPVQTVLAALEARGCRPRRSGAGWKAHCPAHDDRKPSLSVGVGQEGQVLFNCFVGCSAEAITTALGLEMRDLWPDGHPPPGGNGKKPAPQPDKPPKAYPTAQEALEAYGLGKPSQWWPYHDADGHPVMVKARWDGPDGKTFRPVHKATEGWKLGDVPPPRPLYRLPELLKAPPDEPIVVVEGEKCADAAAKLGFVATTSPNGAKSADKADWSPLAGREVWVVPDRDEAGLQYARDVARLAYEADAEAVKILPWEALRPADFKELPPGYDLADWVASFSRDSDPEKALAALAAHIKGVGAQTPPEPQPQAPDVSEADDESPPPALTWKPYPIEALPRPLCDFVEAAAEAMGCDSSFVALPLLTACGAGVGLTRRLKVKADWAVPPILWSIIVGESGSLKTPALKTALQWLQDRQEAWFKDYESKRAEYEQDRLVYEKALSEWRRDKEAGEPPREPEPPVAKRILVADTTMEALAPILQANPRGVLLSRDELAGWVGAFDRYAHTQGGDIAFWLSCYNAVAHTVDRRSKGTLYVPNAGVWITGGIQPGTLQRAFTLPLRESGLLARFLLTWPPRRVKRWTEAEIPQELTEAVGRLFDRLLTLTFESGPDGEPGPRMVVLSPEAKACYQDFFNRHAEELANATGDLAAAFSKLEEIPLRLGLVLHLTRWAAGEPVNPGVVDLESMRRAITLTEWHKHETARINEILERGFEANQQQELIEWIARRGGAVTVRNLYCEGPRRFRGKREDAEAALNELVKAGYGQWTEQKLDQKGGRPKTVFTLWNHGIMESKLHKSRVLRGFDSDSTDSTLNATDLTGSVPNPVPPESGDDELRV